ncbi:MaoC family dehydratase N-terminal domain-containing protein [Sporosarcina luteola]|uniref:FAS1-like dehydratase domain-containing protein n=1 Tax=Sporosarcina luteola TaxID=582850 RepID=UPI00204105DD|nr:MaoC family dehydratase N-terminal domain-containing protein [Sporosarcina luteola]MCM3636882.1 MaoC family dehydratase N-terminal domain-containing protein [Sporosarcina luteola]
MVYADPRLEQIKNTKFDAFTYTIEKGKIKEFAIALGYNSKSYLNGNAVPPTFPTVVEFWGGQISISKVLGLNLSKVLHGEQSYEYVGVIKVGDEITVHTEVEEVFTKAKMNLIVLKKKFMNQHGELVLISRSTIIERH